MTAPVAIITASSRGIGAGTARVLHSRGYRLGLMATSDEVNTIADELGAVAVAGSITDPGAVQRLVATTTDRYGRLDAVVINSGHAHTGDLLTLDPAQWRDGIELLLLSVVQLARLTVPILDAGGGGSIVAVSAYGAVQPSLDFPISSVARAGLSAFVKLVTERYGPSGVRMNAVLPGFVDTYPADDDQLARIPAGRFATVDEIASVIAFLVSSDAKYVTGQSILVDGGLVRSI